MKDFVSNFVGVCIVCFGIAALLASVISFFR